LLTYNRDFAKLVASQAETRRLSDENFRIANLDTLTGLPNRRWFFDTLAALHQRAHSSFFRGDETRLAVGIIDLDGFKPVNRLLVEVGKRLQGICGEGISLARLGGDEFAVLVTGNASVETLKSLGRRITTTLRLPYQIGAAKAQIGSSIGFALYPDNAGTPDMLFERADYALYYAKRHQRGGTVLFSAEHEAQIRDDSSIEQALKAADFERELSVVFQPIVELGTQRVVGMEALARWHSPTLGHVSPGIFIPAAERIGMIVTLTRILLRKALHEAAVWPEDVRLSFNLSAYDLSSPESVISILAAINASRVAPSRIDLEITETAVSQDAQAARAAIDTFKALGVGISLDDFGTGFSSLSHLHSLPLDKLKIDRSFVTDIRDNPASFKIVKSLTALCADMGLTCIVEGVETADQLELLSSLGATFVQGYYFAKPMSGEAARTYLGVVAEPEEPTILRFRSQI
jgi:diguanylate cyclase (GGDEF)-like protein